MKKQTDMPTRSPVQLATFIKFEPVTVLHINWQCPDCNTEYILDPETDDIITCETCSAKIMVSPSAIKHLPKSQIKSPTPKYNFF